MEDKAVYTALRRCQACDKPLPQRPFGQRGGQQRKYCNRACKQRAYRRRVKEREDAGR